MDDLSADKFDDDPMLVNRIERSCAEARTRTRFSKAQEVLISVLGILGLLIIAAWIWDRSGYRVPEWVDPIAIGLNDPFSEPSAQWQRSLSRYVDQMREVRSKRVHNALLKKLNLSDSRWIYSAGISSDHPPFISEQRFGTIQFHENGTATIKPSFFDPAIGVLTVPYARHGEWIYFEIHRTEVPSGSGKVDTSVFHSLEIIQISDDSLSLTASHDPMFDPEHDGVNWITNLWLFRPEKVVIEGRAGTDFFEEYE